MIIFLFVVYLITGLVVAALVERRSQAQGHADMSDVAILVVAGWPAFVAAFICEQFVRLCLPKRRVSR